MGITVGMRVNVSIAGYVAGGGMLVGACMWASGLDVAITDWLWVNYHQDFNDGMRVLGFLGQGRIQIWACVVIGLIWALRRRGRENGLALGWRLVTGIFEQALLWLTGRWKWASRWQGVTVGPRMLLAVVPLLALSGLAQVVLKMLVGRPRPKETLWNGVDPYSVHPLTFDASFWSLPSGHAVSTFALAVWLALAFPHLRWVFGGFAVVLAGSRFLAITPHYLGDVVAGAGIGAGMALALYALMHGGRGRGRV